MTNERDRKDEDTLVSETYRELADERTPQHLNHAVLQMAAGKAIRRGFNFSLWMKPVAWAATIALSLAIVLEFTELPTEVRQADEAVPAAESLPKESMPAAVIDLPESEPKSKVTSFAVSAPGTNQPSAKKNSVSQNRAGFSDAAIPSRQDAAQIEAVVVTAGRSRLAEEKAESDAMTECAPEARLKADSWLACIKDLRALGATEAAAREYEAYSDEYPGELADFEANK
jgi:hypothetical protein